MASSGETGASELPKIIENNDSNLTKCGYCKRQVKEKVQCKKCKLIFHPSCLVTANKSKNSVCIHEIDEKQDIVEKLLQEINLLKIIISEKEEKYSLIKENKHLLEENRLLKENNEFLQGKINEKAKPVNETPKKSNTKNEQIKHHGKKADKQTKESGNENEMSLEQGNSSKDMQNSVQELEVEITQVEIIQGEENEKWQNHSNRKKFHSRKPLFYGTSIEGTVKGIPRKIWFFVSRLNPEMKEGELKSIILNKCHQNSDIIVEKQTLYYDHQSAFKVGIPVEFEEQANNASFWPINSRINKFDFFLARRKLLRLK